MTRYVVTFMILAIVVAHVFLWRSNMPVEYKLIFTTINAVAWTIVLAPIFLIGRWLDAVEARNRQDHAPSDADPADMPDKDD